MIVLADRGVVSVSGPDAASLLQGIVTNDMDHLAEAPAIHTALLTPQGKMLADFFVVGTGDGLLLDVPRSVIGDLVKRLTLYRLRAKVDIRDVSAERTVAVAWDRAPEVRDAIVYPDPRLAAMGWRVIAPATPSGPSDPDAYHAHRIGLGVPEGGRDFIYGETFPHEALLDQLHGVSFTKGCYVGQEIVSRMQHRGTARKRIVRVVSGDPAATLPGSGESIVAGTGTAPIGTLGSTAGGQGLALVRLDRAAEAIAAGEAIRCGPVEVRLEVPAWATFRLA